MYDDFEDIPTTPISDMTESEAEVSQSMADPTLTRKISSSTLSSSGLEGINKQFDNQILKSARYFQNAKPDVQELKYYRDRFDLIRKHALKIGTNVSEFPVPPLNTGADHLLELKKEQRPSQRQIMAETKLSSQLIRLEGLVKNGMFEQEELLAKIDGLVKERELKDERYRELLGMVCHVPSAMIPELLSKVINE
jgi:hypothetical protein